jgi:hypothetical protein
MQLTMSVQVMHSSGIFSLFERSLRYPKWWVHSVLIGACVVFSSAADASSCVVLRGSVSGFGFVLEAGGFSGVVISVRQWGHARYGSGLSKARFMAFRGFAKGLAQDGFGHVQFRLMAAASFLLVMMRPSSNMRESRVYSVNAFEISSPAVGSAEHGLSG